jgi:hypothetical protein
MHPTCEISVSIGLLVRSAGGLAKAENPQSGIEQFRAHDAPFECSQAPLARTATVATGGQRPSFRGLSVWQLAICLITLCCIAIATIPAKAQQGKDAKGKDLTEKMVKDSIEKGKRFLIQQQSDNGAWNDLQYTVGKTSLSLMALINCGMSMEDESVQKAVKYLRDVREPVGTYEVALQIMALAAVKDGTRDTGKILSLSQRLAKTQVKQGQNSGGWSYATSEERGGNSSDRSNAQFAVLGLREAQYAGVPVNREIWELVRDHWTSQQSADGGWSYSGPGGGSTGSMTVAGVTTQVIVDTMLRDDKDENPDGTPNCCGDPVRNESLERGVKWLERNFAVGHNPANGNGIGGTLYYLYGLERAGRLSGRRFFGAHDWYREGADFLIRMQLQNGSWNGQGHGEEPIVATCFSLLFLSKGLAPVLINKLEYEAEDDNLKAPSWNRHPQDIRNLTELITGLPGWPKLVTWQQLSMKAVAKRGGLEDLMLSPILYISGNKAPRFKPDEIELLRQYVLNGGLILGVATCNKTDFDAGFRQVVKDMYPDGEQKLKRLTAEHPVFRSEYLIDPDANELWGVDVGCRTSIIYSPYDIGCLWDKWSIVEPPRRSAQMKAMITKSTRTGVNIVAYATGREPPGPLENHQLDNVQRKKDEVDEGFLQIAKLRHTGGWDAAPNAVRNLLFALNDYAGVMASTKVKNLTPVDENLKNYPLVYMHGRNSFTFSKQEQERLKLQLDRGAMLFADSCCASPAFDRSFREMIVQMFPEQKLQRIPATHELFSTKIAHDLHAVKRREPGGSEPGQPFRPTTIVGEPVLEGIEINGRYVVIYSKYDLSCALERQSSAACPGYLPEDARNIAVNVVLYSLLPK